MRITNEELPGEQELVELLWYPEGGINLRLVKVLASVAPMDDDDDDTFDAILSIVESMTSRQSRVEAAREIIAFLRSDRSQSRIRTSSVKPVHNRAASVVRRPVSTDASAPNVSPPGRRAILLVDDEAGCRNPIATLLRCEGYYVDVAANGLEALEALRQRDFDLVLLDLLMPVMDGLATLGSIRKNPKWGALPVLISTHEHNPQILAQARQIGFQEYIFKGDTPFSKLLELIKRHLGEHFVPRRRGRKPRCLEASHKSPNENDTMAKLWPFLKHEADSHRQQK